jgi:hypothetical protein
MHHLFYECAKLKAHTPADSETTAVNSGWLEWGSFHELLLLVSVGDMAANATFDITVQQATDSSGTGAKNIVGKDGTDITFAQMTQAGTDSNKAVIASLLPEYLDVDNRFTHVRFVFTPATAAVEFAAFVFGLHPRFAPIASYTSDYEQVVGP